MINGVVLESRPPENYATEDGMRMIRKRWLNVDIKAAMSTIQEKLRLITNRQQWVCAILVTLDSKTHGFEHYEVMMGTMKEINNPKRLQTSLDALLKKAHLTATSRGSGYLCLAIPNKVTPTVEHQAETLVAVHKVCQIPFLSKTNT